MKSPINAHGLSLMIGGLYQVASGVTGHATVTLTSGGYVENPWYSGAPGGETSLVGRYFQVTGMGPSHGFYAIEEIGSSTTKAEKGDVRMKGAVYVGAVVRTKMVPAGEGITGMGVERSEVVYSSASPFLALSVDAARAELLAKARATVKDLALDDPTEPVEVKLVNLGA